MRNIVASIKDFYKKFPKSPKEGPRKGALERYFKMHGVIKVLPSDAEWPELEYPNRTVLDSKIKEVVEKRKVYSQKLGEWKRHHFSASTYHQVNQVKKLAEPLYWQHMAKMATDSEYRKDADAVKLPAHLVSDKKWKPMVKMFVNDEEYRKQLAETVSTSIVYKKNKKVARFADDLRGFRMDAAQKQVNVLEKKVLELEENEKALREMLKWAKS